MRRWSEAEQRPLHPESGMLGAEARGRATQTAPTEDPALSKHFPGVIQALPPFEGPFDAYRLAAERCEVLFASYPAGSRIEAHSHESRNCGVVTEGELILIRGGTERRYGPGQWYTLEPGEVHAARFERETSEVEFWFEASRR